MTENNVSWWMGEQDGLLPISTFEVRSGVMISAWCTQVLTKRALLERLTIERFSTDGEFEGSFDDLLEMTKNLGGHVISVDIPLGDESNNSSCRAGSFTAVWPGGFAFVDADDEHWVEISILTVDPKFGLVVRDSFQPLLKKRGRKQEVYALVKSNDSYDLSSLGTHGLILERGNYNPDVIESYEHALEDLQERSPCGRIVLIEGPPGTGKTHIIKGFIQESKNTTFVLLPPSLVEGISGPQIIQALVGWRRNSTGAIVFVLEDADAVLSSRKFDNMNAVNEVLNLGDGILGAALDIRIIATTNTGDDDIDKAILRDGRLCRRINVAQLDLDVAMAMCERLKISLAKDEEPPKTIAEIYGRKRSSFIKKSPKRGTGF